MVFDFLNRKSDRISTLKLFVRYITYETVLQLIHRPYLVADGLANTQYWYCTIHYTAFLFQKWHN